MSTESSTGVRRSLRRVPAWAIRALPLILGVTIAVVIVQFARGLSFDPDDAALGTYTESVYGYGQSDRVHCSDNRDSALCLASYQAAGRPPIVLWLGNSQLHGINRYELGQSTAPMLLHRMLQPKGLYLVAFSQPNANTLEYRVLFDRLINQYRVKTVIVGISLDKFRETGVRAELQDSPTTITSPKNRHYESLQAFTEAWLGQHLDAHLGLWRDRTRITSWIRYALQFGLHRALGITAQTARRVSDALYQGKIAALKGLVADARQSGISVILYAQPYRSDVPGPTPPAQYRHFLSDLQGLAVSGAVEVLDLTELVPGPDWGIVRDTIFGFEDYDFMHFTAAGHRLLALVLARKFGIDGE